GNGLHARRVHAPLADGLAVRARGPGEELREDLAVGLGLDVGSLPAEHADVVVEAEVADAVVLVEELALRRERLRQIRRRAVGTERDGVVLVLQHDDEHVLDGREAGGGAGAPTTAAREPDRARDGQRGDQQTAYHAMTATMSPAPTVAPASTRISEIVPARPALMWFSIFLASPTDTVCH